MRPASAASSPPSPASFEKFFGAAAKVCTTKQLLAPTRGNSVASDRPGRKDAGPDASPRGNDRHLRLRTLSRAQRRTWLEHGIEDTWR